MRKTLLAVAAASFLAWSADAARAEIVELTDGRVLQGDVNAGRTTDDGLALDLYDTGGTTVVKWGHIEEARRDRLRLEILGISDAAPTEAWTLPADVADLVGRLRRAMLSNRWKDSLSLLDELKSSVRDRAVRDAIRLDLLEARVVKARDAFYERAVPAGFFRVMDEMILAKARERATGGGVVAPGANAPAPGSLAAARKWAGVELLPRISEQVASLLGLTRDEFDGYWRTRHVSQTRKASYGTGTFVVEKANAPTSRRPPVRGVELDRPLTDEQWWQVVGPEDRRRWLTALFVESSGALDVLSVVRVNCSACGGSGTTDADRHLCRQCNGCGVVRSVTYR